MACTYQKRSRMRRSPAFFLRALNLAVGLSVACIIAAVCFVVLELFAAFASKKRIRGVSAMERVGASMCGRSEPLGCCVVSS